MFSLRMNGILLPLIFGLAGLWLVVFQEGCLPRRGPIRGHDALVAGVIALGVGAFCHVHYYWAGLDQPPWWVTPARVVIAVVTIAIAWVV